MNMLAATTTSPVYYKVDYIAIAIVAALALLVIGMVIRKAILNSKAAKPQAFVASEIPSTASAPTTSGALAKGSAGKIKLHDVDPKTAALLMAIVADKTGKPLNELRFISIKEVK